MAISTDSQNRSTTRTRRVPAAPLATSAPCRQGRYQARFTDETGQSRTAPITFATKREADDHLMANPCKLPRAAEVKTAERKRATPTEVIAIADAMPDHLSAAAHVGSAS